MKPWIATAFGLAMADSASNVIARSAATREPWRHEAMDCHGLRPRNDGFGLERHREERSDAAIHAGMKPWIATAYGLAMTALGSNACLRSQ
jgi:type IV secretory pathway TrbD component